MTDQNKRKSTFQNIFVGKDYDWKISDMDDYLNGNEFDYWLIKYINKI